MILDCKKYLFLSLPLVALFVFSQEAFALANQTGPGLPGETALTSFRQFVLGPVGFTLSMLGIIAVGTAVIRGGEMGTMMSAGVYTLIGVGFILGASQVVMLMFPGAVITEADAEFILMAIGIAG